jgi:hypothetical protein
MELNLKLREFTISRSTWRSGDDGIHKHGNGLTLLQNKEGYCCCLGQIAKQIGFVEKDIAYRGEPCLIPKLQPCILTRLDDYDDGDYYYNSKFSDELMAINDDRYIDIIERERQIIEKAKEFKVTIKFE